MIPLAGSAAPVVDLARVDSPPPSRGVSPTGTGDQAARATAAPNGAEQDQRALGNVRTDAHERAGVSHSAASSATPSFTAGCQAEARQASFLPEGPDAHEARRRAQQSELVAFHVPPAMQRQNAAAASCCGGGVVPNALGAGALEPPSTSWPVGSAIPVVTPLSVPVLDATQGLGHATASAHSFYQAAASGAAPWPGPPLGQQPASGINLTPGVRH